MAAAAQSGQSPAAASADCCASNTSQSTATCQVVDPERLLVPAVIGNTRPKAEVHRTSAPICGHSVREGECRRPPEPPLRPSVPRV